MKIKKIFATGMFRSGTTFLAKLINSNKKITFISDSFFSVFKFAKNDFFNENIFNKPFDDYLYLNPNLKEFNKFQKLNLKNLKFKKNLKQINKIINKDTKKFSPEFNKKTCLKIKNDNYHLLFKEIFDILHKVKNNYIVGLKEVWVVEFIPLLINFDKNIKNLIIIRDPRAVIASNFHSKQTYPLVFLIKQWKKISNLAFYYKKKFPKKVYLIKFENLIENPIKEIRRINNFLKLKNGLTNSDIKKLKWTQNTSYNIYKKKFNKMSIHKWKEILTRDEIKFIEKYCFIEMEMFNYKRDYINKKNFWWKSEIPKRKVQLSKWIKPFVKNLGYINLNFLNIENLKFSDFKSNAKFKNKYLYNNVLYSHHKKIFRKLLL